MIIKRFEILSTNLKARVLKKVDETYYMTGCGCIGYVDGF